ncbi:ADP-ribosylation factor GTPase-activating protein AGD14 [Heracleum sosnowskyi]|uniref:ADP-ribosylation factor GTPase-activating protein AGD14 n=1 Tax=Heracleum sosnowskyi TaxID=360622 RepID=A0AAD8IF98_9APIA|nr:ADP-ribosylation factor GTPase-activating protein AGD14 [Heracleum sosnowskyi]
MSQRKREEERRERVIRGLLKLPENKRCINCNQLGPQYVCTTFLTFVCTTCSGVHREFSHRVKSVSMAKFNSEEVTALQAAGNERARQIYLKAWDPERNTHPNGSDIHKIRDFIRHVYVDRRYTGARSFGMHTMQKSESGHKGNFYEKHFFEKSGLGSREDFYERRYHERSSSSVRSDRNYRDYFDDRCNRNYIHGKDYKNAEGSSPDSIYERYGTLRSRSAARFEIVDNRNQNDRYGRRSQSFRIFGSDTSMSPEPLRITEKADNMASESQKITEKASLPVLRPLKDIMGESPPTLQVSDLPKAIKAKDANGAAYDQKESFTDRHGSADVKADDNKAATASGLIQYDNKSESPDTSTKGQTESGSSIQSWPMRKTNDPPSVNTVEYLLFELSGLQVGNASENPISNAASLTSPVTLSTSALASSAKPVASSIVPTDSSTPVASSAVPKASSNEPVTSSTTTTGNVLTPRTSPRTTVTPAGEAAAASSSVDNTQNPLSSVYTVSRTSPTGINRSTSPQGAPTFEAFFDQPMPSLSAPTAQKAPGYASANQSSQAVSEAAPTTASPGNGSKSTERKELPAELFTFSYPSYAAPINNWQPRPPYVVGYGMQYAPSPNVTAFHGSAKSRNPFDIGDDSGPVQGAMSSSIASFPGAIAQMSPHAGLQPQPSPFAYRLPPESPSYATYMSTGGYMGQQLPYNTSSPRPQGIGSLGGNDNGNTSFASLNPIQHSTGAYSNNLIPKASNSFSSAGGNPFA